MSSYILDPVRGFLNRARQKLKPLALEPENAPLIAASLGWKLFLAGLIAGAGGATAVCLVSFHLILGG